MTDDKQSFLQEILSWDLVILKSDVLLVDSAANCTLYIVFVSTSVHVL